MTKAEIRIWIAEQKRKARPLEPRSIAVLDTLHSLDLFTAAKSIGAYMPMADEVDLTPLLQTPGKTIFIPAFDNQIDSYRMAKWTPDLKRGRFGIPEPSAPVFARHDELDLILIPGMAFDLTGRRLGRGGGFYDRLLPQYRAVRAGICFDFQCMETVPSEDHDVSMDYVISETRILRV